MTKTMTIGLIALAFVAGSIMTGAIAFADDDDDDELSQLACEAGKIMTAILFDDDDITDILCATDNINDADSDPSNEDQTLSGTGEVVLGTTAAGDGGGTVTCADITGDASLCDGDDAVDDADSSTTNELSTGYTKNFPPPGNVVVFDASCDNPGDIVVGGGTWTDANDGIQLRESRPLDIDTWRVAAEFENNGGNAPLTKLVVINCITP